MQLSHNIAASDFQYTKYYSQNAQNRDCRYSICFLGFSAGFLAVLDSMNFIDSETKIVSKNQRLVLLDKVQLAQFCILYLQALHQMLNIYKFDYLFTTE